MRIERVIARNFAEASDLVKRRHGPNSMVLATSKVDGMTELLVALDGSVERRSEPNQQSTFTPDVVAASQPTASAGRAPGISPGGARMVDAIRKELVALEHRLNSISEAAQSVDLKMNLLEQGVSAAYAQVLLDAGTGCRAAAQRLMADLSCMDLAHLQRSGAVLVVGPAGSGKTTLTMQLACTLKAGQSAAPSVVGLRDPRPGSRERFFGMADLCGLEAQWNATAVTRAVIDSGGSLNAPLDPAVAAVTGAFNVLCLPANCGRGAALRCLQSGIRVDAVVICFWERLVLPLGLLSLLAELKLPLLGVSATADPRSMVLTPSPDALQVGLEAVLALCLNPPAAQAA